MCKYYQVVFYVRVYFLFGSGIAKFRSSKHDQGNPDLLQATVSLHPRAFATLLTVENLGFPSAANDLYKLALVTPAFLQLLSSRQPWLQYSMHG